MKLFMVSPVLVTVILRKNSELQPVTYQISEVPPFHTILRLISLVPLCITLIPEELQA